MEKSMKQNWKIGSLITKSYAFVQSQVYAHARDIAIVLGFVTLTFGIADISMAQSNDPQKQMIWGICNVMALTEGAFGGVVMAVSGLIAVVSAALGAYRAALSLLIVALGSYLVRPVMVLFFGDWVCATGTRVPPG
jgi:hypothetical protein